MRYILFSLLTLFSSYSYSAIKVTSSYFPSIPVGSVHSSSADIINSIKSNACILNTNCYSGRCYIKTENASFSASSTEVSIFNRLWYFEDCPESTSWGRNGNAYVRFEKAPVENYCDSIQYQLDYDKAKQACDAKATDNQTVKFTASCDRENEVLVQQCEITDKPKPPPEYCPDGSIKPESGICPDIDTGGGGDGGGGDTGGGGETNPPTDLTSVIAAITKGAGDIVEANKADDEMLGVGIAALDKSNDLLTNIKDITSGLGGNIDQVNNSVNQIDDSINDAAKENFNRVINEIDKSFEESKKQTELDTQSLNTQSEIKNSVDDLNITIKENKTDLSKIEGSLVELNAGNAQLLEMLNRPAGDYVHVPFFSEIISSDRLTSAINTNDEAKIRYRKLLDDFKESVSITSDFEQGTITDKGFNLTVNNQSVHVESGVQKFVDLADVIRPVIIALCSLISVAIFFRAD